MTNRVPSFPNLVLALYDNHSRILWLSGTRPPYTATKVLGQFAWFALDPADAADCQAAMTRAVATDEPQAVVCHVKHAGPWVVWFFPLHRSGQARFLGVCFPVPPPLLKLTDRERTILALIAGGLSAKRIAHQLGIARSTVDVHRRNAAKRIGVSTSELLLWCGKHSDWF